MSTAKVTRQEELLYGEAGAIVVRLTGQAATNAELACEEAREKLELSREADGITTGDRDPDGRSPHTAFVEDEVWSPLWDLAKTTREALADMADKMARRERQFRQVVDSAPSVPHETERFPTPVPTSA